MPVKSKVALIRCETYEPRAVEAAVARGLELLGGIGQFVRPGESLLLKPNLLAADPPEKCVTTHPAVFRAAARLFQAAGARVSYGDSPGSGLVAFTARKAGLESAARELGVPLADFTTPVAVSFPEGRQNKKFLLAQAAARHVGAIINLPKLKTHGLMRMTGAVKNLFGCIPGVLKAEFHVKLPDAFRFARMLVDLNLLLAPRLHIMDGIRAMDGNGPRSGDPVALNVLLLSADGVALDATAARLLGVDPNLTPTAALGLEQGLGTWQENEIEVVGEPRGSFMPRRFRIVKIPVPQKEPSGLVKRLKQWVVPRPVIRAAACTRCGTCVKSCPVSPKAVDWRAGDKKKPPAYNYSLCIRCYCCQELCPERAIRIKTPLLGRLIRRG